mmetsp:Transcript_79582/g.257786  ORF Transcript_79582/g.257786 Transcript_79582/m.257786 type:complete len:262 (-) Transcript_79582:242-1027(-)
MRKSSAMDQASVEMQLRSAVIMRQRDSKPLIARMSLSKRRARKSRASLKIRGSIGRSAPNTVTYQRSTMRLSSQFHGSRKKSMRRTPSFKATSMVKRTPKMNSSTSKTSSAPGQTSAAAATPAGPGASSIRPLRTPSNCASTAMISVFTKMRPAKSISKAGLRTSLRRLRQRLQLGSSVGRAGGSCKVRVPGCSGKSAVSHFSRSRGCASAWASAPASSAGAQAPGLRSARSVTSVMLPLNSPVGISSLQLECESVSEGSM